MSMRAAMVAAIPEAERDTAFSLARSGLLYRFERRVGLITDASLGIKGRILVFLALSWVPIVILSSFKLDAGVSLRLLFSGPLLIAADALIDFKLSIAIAQFRSRGLIEDEQGFFDLFATAQRQVAGSKGTLVEAALLVAVLVAGLRGLSGLPAASVWYSVVALPMLRFLELRWVWRFSAWALALWKISRLELKLSPSHPDLMGGLGFLSQVQESFALLWIPVSVIATYTVATAIETGRKPITAYYGPVAALCALELVFLLAPLSFFIARLTATKRAGLLKYGRLASHYAQEFDRKWLTQTPSPDREPLLGSPDLQSFADLGSDYERVENMRTFPAQPASAARIVLLASFPFLALLFVVFPVEKVLQTMLKLLL